MLDLQWFLIYDRDISRVNRVIKIHHSLHSHLWSPTHTKVNDGRCFVPSQMEIQLQPLIIRACCGGNWTQGADSISHKTSYRTASQSVDGASSLFKCYPNSSEIRRITCHYLKTTRLFRHTRNFANNLIICETGTLKYILASHIKEDQSSCWKSCGEKPYLQPLIFYSFFFFSGGGGGGGRVCLCLCVCVCVGGRWGRLRWSEHVLLSFKYQYSFSQCL